MNYNRNFEFQKQKARSHYPNQTAQSVFDSQNLVSLTSVMLYRPNVQFGYSRPGWLAEVGTVHLGSCAETCDCGSEEETLIA